LRKRAEFGHGRWSVKKQRWPITGRIATIAQFSALRNNRLHWRILGVTGTAPQGLGKGVKSLDG